MKILNTTSKTFEGNNLDYYDFDKLSSFEDVKFLLEYLEKIKFKLDYFYVSEFGDYEDVPLRVSYSKDDIDKVLTDFAGKKIDLYKLIFRPNHTVFRNRLEYQNPFRLDI